MSTEVSAGIAALDKDVHLSYFANTGNQKLTKVSHARLIDISDAGLCMEVSLPDSGLFMESLGSLYLLCKDIELQIFCRSHPINISVPAKIKWHQRSRDLEMSNGVDNICLGVLFCVENPGQRSEIVELVRHLGIHSTTCNTCNATIASSSALCYNCGTKPARKRTFFKKMIYSLLADGTHA